MGAGAAWPDSDLGDISPQAQRETGFQTPLEVVCLSFALHPPDQNEGREWRPARRVTFREHHSRRWYANYVAPEMSWLNGLSRKQPVLLAAAGAKRYWAQKVRNGLAFKTELGADLLTQRSHLLTHRWICFELAFHRPEETAIYGLERPDFPFEPLPSCE